MKILPDNSPFCFLALVVVCAACSYAQTTLLGAVNVSSETISFSDLLPQTATPELRGLTKNIDLGRAPQLGAMRVLRRDQIAEALESHPEFARRLSIPEQIVVTRSGYPLDLSDIRRAVAEFLYETAGLTDFPDSALDWPHSIATASVHQHFQVRATRWDAARKRLFFLMRCAEASACVEFLVSLRPPESLTGKYQTKPNSNSTREMTSAGDASILITSGHKARLLLQSDGMQISLQVICLENGREGETIRVRESGSSRVFRAQVVNRDLLLGRLES